MKVKFYGLREFMKTLAKFVYGDVGDISTKI